MIAKGVWQSRDSWAAPFLLVALSGALLLAGDSAVRALEFRRAAIASGQWWRLWTCNFVHLGAWHYSLNAASLVLLAALCPQPLPARVWLARIFVLCGGVGLGLYLFAPGIGQYVGLSGMVYGLFFLGLGRQGLRGDRIAWVCLLFLAGRIAEQWFWGAPDSETHLIGGAVVAESHVFGVISAAVYALFCAGVYHSSFKSGTRA